MHPPQLIEINNARPPTFVISAHQLVKHKSEQINGKLLLVMQPDMTHL